MAKREKREDCRDGYNMGGVGRFSQSLWKKGVGLNADFTGVLIRKKAKPIELNLFAVRMDLPRTGLIFLL